MSCCCCGSCLRVEDLARLEHGMHDDRQFARHGRGGTLETDPFAQPEPPCPQAAFGLDAGQDDCCGLVGQPPQIPVAASGYMAGIVDIAGLVASCRQADPGSDGSRVLEKLSGSSIAATKDVAVTTLMPGTDMRRRQPGFWRAVETNWVSSSATRTRMLRQAPSKGSTIATSFARPARKLRTFLAKLFPLPAGIPACPTTGMRLPSCCPPRTGAARRTD